MTHPFILPPPSSVPGPFRPTPPPIPNSAGVVTPHVARWHVVQPGETLYSLARHYYRNPGEWVRIFNANREGVYRPDKTPGTLTDSTVIPAERLHIP